MSLTFHESSPSLRLEDEETALRTLATPGHVELLDRCPPITISDSSLTDWLVRVAATPILLILRRRLRLTSRDAIFGPQGDTRSFACCGAAVAAARHPLLLLRSLLVARLCALYRRASVPPAVACRDYPRADRFA